MGLTAIFEKGGEDYHDYKKALKSAKRSIEELCEITERMEDKYGDEDSKMHEKDEYPEFVERGGIRYRRMR